MSEILKATAVAMVVHYQIDTALPLQERVTDTFDKVLLIGMCSGRIAEKDLFDGALAAILMRSTPDEHQRIEQSIQVAIVIQAFVAGAELVDKDCVSVRTPDVLDLLKLWNEALERAESGGNLPVFIQ